ncbi:MAG: triose-phosphate isomerase [Clostridiales bacterium]|nr:triose-phosphate isomerase [Clostridiales bacterium]
MRKPIIAGNWKMNHAPAQAATLLAQLIPLLHETACDVVVCPPFVSLSETLSLTRGTPIAVGAQNCHIEKSGAFTGEVAPDFLAEMGVRYVILGHSERREYFGETDAFINRKVRAALSCGLIPIVCVGETLAQREDGVTAELVSYQTRAALAGLSPAQVGSLVIAYEPIWAIGTGMTATAADANTVIGIIRGQVRKTWGDAADMIRIQYGGSMKPGNAAELMAQPEIDGGLVGGASLNADDFAAIVHYQAERNA